MTNCHDSEVRKILNSSSRTVKLCHPLCSCDQCEKVLDRHRNDPEAVTVFSRDDLGRTALHIAADYGKFKTTGRKLFCPSGSRLKFGKIFFLS